MELTTQKGKRIGIFGMGETGISVFNSLYMIAEKILCDFDRNTQKECILPVNIEKFIVQIDDIEWMYLDKIVISPGVPREHKIFELARKYNIQISSDIELFYEEISKNSPNSLLITVTGTNGKSTTVSLIHHLLKSCGMDYQLCGNIGTSVLSTPIGKEGYIIELSSFQLDLLSRNNYHLNKSAVLLNITPDHLDRYENLDEYSNSKSRIFEYSSFGVICIEDDNITNLFEKIQDKQDKTEFVICSNNINSEAQIIYNDNGLVDKYFESPESIVNIRDDIVNQIGKQNIAASYAVARKFGISREEIVKYINSFKPLPHRKEYIGNISLKNNCRVDFYNDSKATNLSSALYSLRSFNNIIWLAGGIYKEKSLNIPPKILNNIRMAYIFGKDKDIFEKYLKTENIDFVMCNNLESAFNFATKYAETLNENSVILLAPAAASLDQFKNFEHRGDVFRDLFLEFVELHKKNIC